MSAAELAEAEQAVRNLQFAGQTDAHTAEHARPLRPRADPRATLREARRRAGEIQRIERKAPRVRYPDLVALCDISGSMSVYSRMLLRYLHAITHATRREWGPCPRLHLRHDADQRHPRLEAERSRPRPRRRRARGQRLGGRHAHRCVAGAVQQGVVAPRADIRGDRDADHRRAGTRRSRPARPGGRAAFAERRASRVAEPLVALGWGFHPARAASARSWPMWTASTPAIRSTAFRR
jgi:hypothetical protein